MGAVLLRRKGGGIRVSTLQQPVGVLSLQFSPIAVSLVLLLPVGKFIYFKGPHQSWACFVCLHHLSATVICEDQQLLHEHLEFL